MNSSFVSYVFHALRVYLDHSRVAFIDVVTFICRYKTHAVRRTPCALVRKAKGNAPGVGSAVLPCCFSSTVLESQIFLGSIGVLRVFSCWLSARYHVSLLFFTFV